MTFLDKILTANLKRYGKDPSRILIDAGAIGWVLSSAAQITGVKFNPKLTDIQKDTLIKQEAFDGGINIALFYLISQSTRIGFNKLCESGKYLPRKLFNVFNELVDKKIIDMKNFKTVSEALKEAMNKIDNPELLYRAKKGFRNFKTHKFGIGVVLSYATAILSINILTPYLRNKATLKTRRGADVPR